MPKAAVLSHANLSAAVLIYAEAAKDDPDNVANARSGQNRQRSVCSLSSQCFLPVPA